MRVVRYPRGPAVPRAQSQPGAESLGAAPADHRRLPLTGMLLDALATQSRKRLNALIELLEPEAILMSLKVAFLCRIRVVAAHAPRPAEPLRPLATSLFLY